MQYVGYILRRKHNHITECFYLKLLDMNEKSNRDKRMVQTEEKNIQSKSRIAFFFFFENVIGLIGSTEIYKFTTTMITLYLLCKFI